MERIDLVKTLLAERRTAMRSLRRVLDREQEYLPGEFLGMLETHFLSAIGESGATGTEIANSIPTSLSAVSQLANRLEKRGFVFRSKASNDKRQSLFFLTEKGKAIRAAHEAQDELAYGRISERLSCYSEEELRYLIEYEKKAAAMYGN